MDAPHDGALRILGLIGSLRAASYNRKLFRAATELAPPDLELTIATLGELPPYNADVDAQGDPPAVATLRGAIRDASALLIVSPEYNYGVPGFLKNAIDWISRPPGKSPLERKPAAVMGASQGLGGTLRMQAQLRLTLQSVEMYVMPKPEIFLPHCVDKFDADGRLPDEKTRERIKAFMAAFRDWTRRF